MKTLTETRKSMRDSMPVYYAESVIANNIVERNAKEGYQLLSEAYMLLNQLFIGTATWSLPRWEAIFGVKTVSGQTNEQRREVLRSKLRSNGAVTIAMIKAIASSYGNGDVDVTLDVKKYMMNVSFTSVVGIPAQIGILQSVLRDVIPAHYVLNFVLKYLLIKDVHNTMTLGQVEQRKLSDFAGGS